MIPDTGRTKVLNRALNTLKEHLKLIMQLFLIEDRINIAKEDEECALFVLRMCNAFELQGLSHLP